MANLGLSHGPRATFKAKLGQWQAQLRANPSRLRGPTENAALDVHRKLSMIAGWPRAGDAAILARPLSSPLRFDTPAGRRTAQRTRRPAVSPAVAEASLPPCRRPTAVRSAPCAA